MLAVVSLCPLRSGKSGVANGPVLLVALLSVFHSLHGVHCPFFCARKDQRSLSYRGLVHWRRCCSCVLAVCSVCAGPGVEPGKGARPADDMPAKEQAEKVAAVAAALLHSFVAALMSSV